MDMKIKKSNLILGALIIAFAIVSASFFFPLQTSLTVPSPTTLPVKAHQSDNYYHGALLASTGCAACHLDPIIADCLDCHPHPPQVIADNIAFPHHNETEGGPFDNCDSPVCHDAEDDIRYITTPEAEHDYCEACHTFEHSTP